MSEERGLREQSNENLFLMTASASVEDLADDDGCVDVHSLMEFLALFSPRHS